VQHSRSLPWHWARVKCVQAWISAQTAASAGTALQLHSNTHHATDRELYRPFSGSSAVHEACENSARIRSGSCPEATAVLVIGLLASQPQLLDGTITRVRTWPCIVHHSQPAALRSPQHQFGRQSLAGACCGRKGGATASKLQEQYSLATSG
jgi:hypothetical protein